MTAPTWWECLDAGMSRREAASARGVSYSAARKFERLYAVRFRQPSTTEVEMTAVVARAIQSAPVVALRSRSRLGPVAKARHEAMRRLCDAGWTREQVAYFLRRDPSSVSYGIKRANGGAAKEAGV